MQTFEWTLLLVTCAVALSAVAGKLAIPYPTFLALGGMAIAFLPFTPQVVLAPDLALALFVAPVLLDAAYDASPRDLRRNVVVLGGLVFGAIAASTAAVAVVAHYMIPDMSWPVAIVLGAMLAPPDAVAATAILRRVRLPHNILVILEGESLLNDASALLIYRLALGAVGASGLRLESLAPTFALVLIGSLVMGVVLGRVSNFVMARVDSAPASAVLQLCGTFGVWILAERLHLSGVLTIVAYAVSIARRAPGRTPARLRVSSYAVWETVVFLMNIMAFVLIGLQLRPIVEGLAAPERPAAFRFASAMLATVIVTRVIFVLGFACAGALRRKVWPPKGGRPIATIRGAVAVSWSGMRGIVTLAAAFALPETGDAGGAFPFRNLILLTAFVVVLGTLVIQGTTLRPLLALLNFKEDDALQREIDRARSRVFRTALATLDGDESSAAAAVRSDYYDTLMNSGAELAEDEKPTGNLSALRITSIEAGRKMLLDLRRIGEIGDDAFHVIEGELDMAQLNAESGPS